jgi:CDP-6-deoxy-D-xylo-4-hexulose-3-dehydrase
MKIPLASSGLRKQDIEAAKLVLDSTHYTMGNKVSEFESLMADYLRVDNFVMVNSGSSANLVIFEALLRPSIGKPKLMPGDRILVPAVAWPTTIWPIVQLGLRPVFVDVNKDSLAIDLKLAQKMIDQQEGIKAIFPIHPLGFCIDHESLDSFCSKNSLVQINDVCESLGSWRGDLHAGTSGLGSSFSFYFSHHITTMEGGGIATNNLEFADDIRAMRSHGWSRDRTDALKWKNDFNSELSTSLISQNQLSSNS